MKKWVFRRIVFCAASLALSAAATAFAASGVPVVVTVDPATPIRHFDPELALGAGVDGLEQGGIKSAYTPSNLAAMKSAGLGSLTYRLRTELAGDAWHWNPEGTWSDSAHHQGYWVSSSKVTKPITTCYGYRLPRRGNTIDQAENDGYSRLDDGDAGSFWKSNPYLDEHFTGESNALHPQWVVMDLLDSLPVTSIHLSWGLPFARRYKVEYWTGTDSLGENDSGVWRAFPGGQIHTTHGGETWLRLCQKAVKARFVRIVLLQSSRTGPANSKDIRDRVGFSLREVGLGWADEHNHFHDVLTHARNQKQTPMYVSSCDPWHRATDRDPNVEQPGFTLVSNSGLFRGHAVLMPVAVLYDNPDNAVAMVRYLQALHVPLRGLELGEEPDGQMVDAADYAALYTQFARRIRQVDKSVPLGGPSFQTVNTDNLEWPTPSQDTTWLERVLHYLKAHGTRRDFQFCSFEWYPFDDVCAPYTGHLRDVHRRLAIALQRFAEAGLPQDFPLYITEYGYSAFAAQAEVDLPGMVFDVDSVCYFLQHGGQCAYFYGYEPQSLIKEMNCPKNPNLAWGNLALFLTNEEGVLKYRTPAYYGVYLLTHEWAQPGAKNQLWYGASVHQGATAQADVCAYVLKRPDGQWAFALINKNAGKTYTVNLRAPHNSQTFLGGAVDTYTYSGAQYQWHGNGENGFASPDTAPQHRHDAKAPAGYVLPPCSLVIVRGR